MTRPGIEPESTVSVADALSTRNLAELRFALFLASAADFDTLYDLFYTQCQVTMVLPLSDSNFAKKCSVCQNFDSCRDSMEGEREEFRRQLEFIIKQLNKKEDELDVDDQDSDDERDEDDEEVLLL